MNAIESKEKKFDFDSLGKEIRRLNEEMIGLENKAFLFIVLSNTARVTIRSAKTSTWPFIIFSWRGGREGGNAQQLQQSTVEILKCEVPMKRARNILSQRMPLNEVNLF